jgi:hypothetical protein
MWISRGCTDKRPLFWISDGNNDFGSPRECVYTIANGATAEQTQDRGFGKEGRLVVVVEGMGKNAVNDL